MNSTIITGSLVRDPELRFTPSGHAVANFSVAEKCRWQDRISGEWQESTNYLDIVAWGDLGEHTAASLAKGDRVTVTGQLDQRSWETPEGDRRTELKLVATDVAASLQWAIVQVSKVARRRGDEF